MRWKIIALVCAMLFLVVGVDYVGFVVAWSPFIGAMWLVFSDKEIQAKCNEFMERVSEAEDYEGI